VFSAQRGGEDVIHVQVRVDGAIVSTTLDGRAVFVDPGAHVVSFDADGSRVDRHLVVAEGERNRKVTVVFGESAPSARAERGAAGASPGVALPILAYVFGAVATVALGTSVFFGLSGKSQLDDLHRCAPTCADSGVTALRRDMIVTDVSLGIGTLAAVATAWLVLTRSRSPAAAARTDAPVLTW
jgi:hypothetical protein